MPVPTTTLREKMVHTLNSFADSGTISGIEPTRRIQDMANHASTRLLSLLMYNRLSTTNLTLVNNLAVAEDVQLTNVILQHKGRSIEEVASSEN